jgi:serine protease inhibitor ecotin
MRLGVSRQALASKPVVVEAYHLAQKEVGALEKNSPHSIVRRTLDERVVDLEKQLEERNRQLNSWIEKWVTVEYNCRRYGYEPDKILEPLVKPNRALA